MPPWTSLVDLLLVPLAKSAFSTSATLYPRATASSATPAPVTPPPITRTSNCSLPMSDRLCMRADDDSGCMDTPEHTKEEKIYTFYLSDRLGVGIAARRQSIAGRNKITYVCSSFHVLVRDYSAAGSRTASPLVSAVPDTPSILACSTFPRVKS